MNSTVVFLVEVAYLFNMEIAANDFNKMLNDGRVKHKKGFTFTASAALGQMMEQECNSEKQKTKKVIIPRKESKSISTMKLHMLAVNIPYVPEYKFLKDRFFRFDFAIAMNADQTFRKTFTDKKGRFRFVEDPEDAFLKICIEFDGLFSEKSGHRTIEGVLNDHEKTMLAKRDNWQEMRFHAKNSQTLISELEKLIKRAFKSSI